MKKILLLLGFCPLFIQAQNIKAKLGTGGSFLILDHGTPGADELVKLQILETGEVNWYLDGKSMFIRQSNFEYEPGSFGTYDFFHVDGQTGRVGINVLSNTQNGLNDNLPLTSSVTLLGSLAYSIRVLQLNNGTAYQMRQDDHVLIINKTDNTTSVITLSDVTISKGRLYYLKRNENNNGSIDIKPPAGQKLNGVVDEEITMNVDNSSVQIICDGDSWWVLSEISTVGQDTRRTITTSSTLSNENAVEVNFAATNQIIDLQLPGAADNENKSYVIKRNTNGTVFSGNVVRIVPVSGENVDQGTSASPYIMEKDFESITVQSNGTRWLILNSYNAENAVVAVTSTYTPNKNDKTILADASSASFTVTLPGAATVQTGKTYTVKRTNAGTNTVIVDGNGSETLDGITSLRLNQRFDYLQLQSDGTNWMVIAERISPSSVINPALPYTATVYDGIISSDGNGTINLPGAAAVLGGKIFTIKNSATAGTSTVTVDPNGSETIDGLATWPLAKGQFVTIQSDGNNWVVIGQ